MDWPPCGVIKVNCDTTIDKSRNAMGVGVIVRDHEVNILAAMCSSKPIIVYPIVVEAYAA
jgi:hypothetical protein